MKVWLPKNQDISCAIIGKFIQGNKVEEKHLIHRVVINEGELDFLIQDCIKEGTYAGSDKYLLGHIQSTLYKCTTHKCTPSLNALICLVPSLGLSAKCTPFIYTPCNNFKSPTYIDNILSKCTHVTSK
jgi:hypothetical protein